MNPLWNQIPPAQQQLFLSMAGLDSLPEPSALTEAQWQMLTGIIGEDSAQLFRLVIQGDSLLLPELELPGELGDWSSIMAVVAEIRAKIGEVLEKSSVEDIKIQKDKLADENRLEKERLEKMLKKLEKSAKSGLLGKIFGWIGVAIGLIAAVVATVATLGAAAPAIAVALVGLTVMILQETGVMDKIVKFFAENPVMFMALFGALLGPPGIALGGVLAGTLEGLKAGGVLDADKAQMVAQVIFTVTMLAASIVASIASGGSGAVQSIKDVFKLIGLVGQLIGAATSIGGGAAGVASAGYAFEASMLKADSEEDKAWLAKLQSMLQEEMDRLEKIIEQLNASVVDVSDLLSDIAASHQKITGNLGA